jgi:N-acetylmuramoyl-L-alanine amidase
LRLRTSLFKTRERDQTTSIFLSYINSPPEPRICANVIDQYDCHKGSFGIGWHFLVRMDGTIEQGRDLMTIAAHPRNPWHLQQTCISIGVVGGRNAETFEVENTLTPEQDESIEWLMQHLADELQVPLEVEDRVTDQFAPNEVFLRGWDAVKQWREERRLEREAMMIDEIEQELRDEEQDASE